jgi:hypothetical protein
MITLSTGKNLWLLEGDLMDNKSDVKRHQRVLQCLSSLPRKIINVHQLDNVPEFILHDICDEHCFNILRAAYFVDNPDFNQLKGVAGFCRDEAYQLGDELWNDPDQFSSFMQDSTFNNKVREITIESIKGNDHMHEHIVSDIAPRLGFKEPAWCNWDLKHYNYGLIIYEKAHLDDDIFDEHFINTLYLLGFCAIR